MPMTETRTYASITSPLSRMRSRTSARLEGLGALEIEEVPVCWIAIVSVLSSWIGSGGVPPVFHEPSHGVVVAEPSPPRSGAADGGLDRLQTVDQRVRVLRVPDRR